MKSHVNPRNCIVMFLVIVSTRLGSVRGEDCTPKWLPGAGVPGTDGTIYATITWDPDGIGPLPELLIIGGDFTVVGDIVAPHIAAWDGQSWHALGDGLEGPIFALTEYEGDLIAGGVVYGRAPALLMRWNGSEWRSIDEGLEGAVQSLAVFNGMLTVGGYIVQSDNAGDRVICWDGREWNNVGGKMNDPIRVLAVYNDELIAGGDFTHVESVPVNRIARFDGTSWISMSGGVSFPGTTYVADMITYGGNLIVTGNFIYAGGVGVNNIASWDGRGWSALASGLHCGDVACEFHMQSLAVFQGELIVGGSVGSGDYQATLERRFMEPAGSIARLWRVYSFAQGVQR